MHSFIRFRSPSHHTIKPSWELRTCTAPPVTYNTALPVCAWTALIRVSTSGSIRELAGVEAEGFGCKAPALLLPLLLALMAGSSLREAAVRIPLLLPMVLLLLLYRGCTSGWHRCGATLKAECDGQHRRAVVVAIGRARRLACMVRRCCCCCRC